MHAPSLARYTDAHVRNLKQGKTGYEKEANTLRLVILSPQTANQYYTLHMYSYERLMKLCTIRLKACSIA